MKKLFLFAGLFVAFMTSCTNNELVEVPKGQNSIKFKVPFVTNATRTVTDVTTSGVTSIHAFGVYTLKPDQGALDWSSLTAYFNNLYVSAASGFDTGKTWIPNNVYAFAAYINGADNECLLNEDQESIISFSVNTENGNSILDIPEYDASTNKDLVVAMTNDIEITTGSNVTVPLSFRHVLSKLNFIFLNGESTSYKMQVTDIILENINSKGTARIIKQQGSTLVPFWSSQNTPITKTFNSTTVLEPEASTTISCYTIPGNILDDCLLKFTVKLNPERQDSKEENYEVPLKINTMPHGRKVELTTIH